LTLGAPLRDRALLAALTEPPKSVSAHSGNNPSRGRQVTFIGAISDAAGSNVEGRPVALLPGLRPSLGRTHFGRFAPADPRRRVPPASGLLAASFDGDCHGRRCASPRVGVRSRRAPSPFPRKDIRASMMGRAWTRPAAGQPSSPCSASPARGSAPCGRAYARGVTDGSMAWSACLPMKPRDGPR
jgi:hypothetical protein